MGLVLYDNPASSNALKVRFVLVEAGLSFERREVPLARPRPEEYLRVNPLGLIPALDDDGFVVCESHTIMRYAALRAGRDDLYPAAVRDRVRVDEFLDRFAGTIRPAFFRVEMPALGYVPGQGFGAAPPDAERTAAAIAELTPVLETLEGLVGDRGVVLDRFTIADCALAPVLFRHQRTGVDLEPYPRLSALREAILSRPGWAAADPVA
ncbi:MAG: glutathione S-transferase family protein [Thermoleophilia bacterium]